jgi:hypothetical protein
MRHALDEMSVKKSDIEQKKKASEALKATLSSHPPATGQAPKIPPGSRLRPPTGDRPLRPPVSPNK